MPERLILLPGWGLGSTPLDPLLRALQALDSDWQVQTLALPTLESADLHAWLDDLDARVPDNSWLLGWSLGGMLATALAARRGARCRGLVTLGSNACFVAREGWPQAMPQATFAAFLAGYDIDPLLTLKRFCVLCAQGAGDPRALARQLQAGCAPAPGLALLANLDLRATLPAYAGPQYHLYGDHDALVPVAAIGALQQHLPEARISALASASHAFALEHPEEVAARIHDFFLQERV